MRLFIDVREKDRIATATKYYTSKNVDVDTAELPVGDFLFGENKQKVIFEFKTIPDFIASIIDHRVFNQAIEMAENYDHHFVIIHGDEHTKAKALAMSKNYREVTLFQYLGAIASLNRYTTVIETHSPFIEESYYRMLIQAKKCLSTKPIVKRFPRKDKNVCFNFLCHDIYGINSKKAQLIVDTYHLESLNDLFTLTKPELLQIEGIGEKTASNIIGAIHGS